MTPFASLALAALCLGAVTVDASSVCQHVECVRGASGEVRVLHKNSHDDTNALGDMHHGPSSRPESCQLRTEGFCTTAVNYQHQCVYNDDLEQCTCTCSAQSAAALEYDEFPGMACSGLSDLGEQTGITLEHAKAWCMNEPTCHSFIQKPQSGRYEFSSSCDSTMTPNYKAFDNHNLYVVAHGPYRKYAGKFCGNRDELPAQTGITLDAAKAWCLEEPSCHSFEKTSTPGTFRFSTTCDPTVSGYADRSNFDLYVLTEGPFRTYQGKACTGRNDLGEQRGITLAQARAWCILEPACHSFTQTDRVGRFQFSSSCDPSSSAFVDKGSEWTLHVLATSPFRLYRERVCAGRDDLPSQTGITLTEAKAWCVGEPTCLSFEATREAGSYRFSTSCTPASEEFIYKKDHNLYVLTTRPYQKFVGKACSSRNDLGTMRGISLEEAREWCIAEPTCHSFTKTNRVGKYEFSTSCDLEHADVDKDEQWELHVLTTHPYRRYADAKCQGRDELGTQSDITIAEAKAWCLDEPSCHSFEKDGNTYRFSTTCDPTIGADFMSHSGRDLYVLTTGPTRAYAGKKCTGRNDLGEQRGISLAEARAWCLAEPTCVSFTKTNVSGKFQFSSTCTTEFAVDASSLWELHVLTNAPYRRYSEKVCSGRDDLPTQTGITLADAKAWCIGEPTCLSFEKTREAGTFRFSTSCSPAVGADFRSNSEHDLYVLTTRPYTKYAGKACNGRNDLGTQRQISLTDARAWCIADDFCHSFAMLTNQAGKFEFSSSCDANVGADFVDKANKDLYVLHRTE